jgi:hypothetical protein
VKQVDADWRGTVSRNVRRDAAQTLRKLHVSVNPPGGWEDLLRLHERRWRRRRMPGSFWGVRRRVFDRWLPIGIEAGMVRLSVARLDGAPVAALLGLMEGDRFLYFQAGLDPDAPGSPGTALVAEALDFCAESGRTRFDFLRGQESYKRRWNPEIEVPRGTLALQAPPTIVWCEQVRQNLASAFAR